MTTFPLRPLLTYLAALALSGAGMADANPTCVNLIPTADVIKTAAYAVQLDGDGAPNPLFEGGAVDLLTQFGVCRRVEVGLDLTHLNAATEWSADAKWQFVAEDEHWPALALGGLNLAGREGGRQWYLAASRSLPRLNAQLTVGFLSGDFPRGRPLGLLTGGVDHAPPPMAFRAWRWDRLQPTPPRAPSPLTSGATFPSSLPRSVRQ